MVKPKTLRSTYVTVKIPAELASKLDDYVLSDLGYRSRAEIVNDAIRHFIDQRKSLDEAETRTYPQAEQQQQQRKNNKNK